MNDTEIDKVIQTVDKAVFQKEGEHLTSDEIKVLRGTWEGQDYKQISENCSHSESYIRRSIGPALWNKLTEALGKDISKRNFRDVLEQRQPKSKRGRRELSKSEKIEVQREKAKKIHKKSDPRFLENLIRKLIQRELVLDFWLKWYQKIQDEQPVEAGKLDLWFISLVYHLRCERINLREIKKEKSLQTALEIYKKLAVS